MNEPDLYNADYTSLMATLASFGISFQTTSEAIEIVGQRLGGLRPIEYEEYVVKYPRNLTSEDLSANHAAGLPIIAERVVRCVNCRWFKENATLHDSERPHFCALNGFDMADEYGFCSYGEPKEDK